MKSAAFARDRLEAAVLEYVRGGFQPHDIARLVSGIATELAGPDYQIALRCDELGLDDVVVKDVQMFRMERMDDNRVWLCCYLSDGQSLDIDLWREGKLVKYAARDELPAVVYEEGSRAC